MYDFKHHRNDNERYNTYESYTKIVEPVNIYDNVRDTLFMIALVISIFIATIIAINKYLELHDLSSQTLITSYTQHNEQKDELSHLKLTNAISKSIVHTLQSQPTRLSLNDAELKRIIKRVVYKIEKAPNQTIYTEH